MTEDLVLKCWHAGGGQEELARKLGKDAGPLLPAEEAPRQLFAKAGRSHTRLSAIEYQCWVLPPSASAPRLPAPPLVPTLALTLPPPWPAPLPLKICHPPRPAHIPLVEPSGPESCSQQSSSS